MSLRARGLGKRAGGLQGVLGGATPQRERLRYALAGAAGRQAWAVRGCDLDLEAGRWLGVLGPNGAGKTTLLRLLATVLVPDEGLLLWRGAPAGRGAALRRELGYLPQTFGLPAVPTVREGLAYFAGLKGLSGARLSDACSRALRWAGASALAGAHPGQVSSGAMRSVGLAQAILNDPAVLLLDEPSQGLDPSRRLDLWQRLRALAGERLVVTAETEPNFLQLADEVLLLDGGRPEGPWPVEAFQRSASGRVWELSMPPGAAPFPAPDPGAPPPGLANRGTEAALIAWTPLAPGGNRLRWIDARPAPAAAGAGAGAGAGAADGPVAPPVPGARRVVPTLNDAYVLWRHRKAAGVR